MPRFIGRGVRVNSCLSSAFYHWCIHDTREDGTEMKRGVLSCVLALLIGMDLSGGAFASSPGEKLVCTQAPRSQWRSEEHTSELQSHHDIVCRLLLEKKKK